MAESILRKKSHQFAIKTTRFCFKMMSIYKEFEISRQLLKSGTSPGALLREAQYAESRADFLHKQLIGLKEANESEYWLDIIIETLPDLKEDAISLKQECKEIIAMLVSSTKKLKKQTDSNLK